MIETTVLLVSLFALIAIVIAKFLNVMYRGRFYAIEFVFVTFFLALIFWGLGFTSMLVSSAYQQSGTIIDATGTTTLTMSDNAVYAASQFFEYATLLLLLAIVFTVIESVMLFAKVPIQPKKALQRR